MQQFKRPSAVTIVVAAAAMFALAGGTATAAKLVTGKQIKNGSIGMSDLSSSAKRALKGNTGPQGPQGVPGPAGPSVVGQSTIVRSAQVAFGPTDIAQVAIAFCPAGHRVVSGGGVSISDEQLAASIPTAARDGWGVIGTDLFDNGGEYVEAYAICAPAGQAIAARAGSRESAERMFSKLAAKFEGTRR
jgi:hypothetical protein